MTPKGLDSFPVERTARNAQRLLTALLVWAGILAVFPLFDHVRSEPVAARDPKAESRTLLTPRQNPAHRTLTVTATAYNSIRRETSSTPNYGAWGDRLRPGMKAIAVSRDLLRLGLTHDTRVQISGLPGTYRVLDKMASRWHRRIDIYMGRDVKAALRWGKKRVRIWWVPAKNDQATGEEDRGTAGQRDLRKDHATSRGRVMDGGEKGRKGGAVHANERE